MNGLRHSLRGKHNLHGDSLMIKGHNTSVIVFGKEDMGKIPPSVNRDLLVRGENRNRRLGRFS